MFRKAKEKSARSKRICLQFPGLGKSLKASVVSPLDIIGKTARRQLLHRKMIPDAIAADALFFAAAVRAVAPFKILFFIAFHQNLFTGFSPYS